MAIKVVIPVAGRGSRMTSISDVPKPLIKVDDDNTILSKTIKSFTACDLPFEFIFITREYENQSFNNQLNDIIWESVGEHKYHTHTINYVTQGAACTIALAQRFIDRNDTIITADSDICFIADVTKWINHFNNMLFDSMLITTQSDLPHYSYAALDSNNRVIRTAEKKVISNYASVGIHFWRYFWLFREALDYHLYNNIRTNGEFFVTPLHNHLIDNKYNVGYYQNNNDKFYHLGTPSDLEKYNKYRTEATF